jgi:predicted nucleotidyltransferase
MANESAIKQQDLEDTLTATAAVLTTQRINYAVIGGMATGFRTQPRFTKDVDFLLQIPQLKLPGLLDELAARGITCDPLTTIREWTQQHMTTLSYHGIRVDWLKPVIPLYQHILDRAVDETWQGLPIRVVSAEGLILLKLLAYRAQDVVDIENLVAAHRVTLDLGWIKSEWQTVAGLDDPRMARLVELVAR